MYYRESETEMARVGVIGAGPAGLTAAYHLQKIAPQVMPVVFEASDLVGGIARTESHDGYRFDIGGHRFFTKLPQVQAIWEEVLGDDFITVPRRSRIFYRGLFYDYPLRPLNALGNIGPYEAMRCICSYAKWQLMPLRNEVSFEDYVINRFGGRLYMHFFRSYTEKVWGISPREIQADWAAQRIKNLSLGKAIWDAFGGSNNETSLIEQFQYPRLGPGMMWEKVRDKVTESGGEVRMRHRVEKLHRVGDRIAALDVAGPAGDVERVAVDHVVNTMDLRTLVRTIDPPPPAEVRAAADRLKYRDFLIVMLVLDDPDPFPDNWIYVHSPEVKVGRIQNFRAWSREMVPDEHHASIGMEYFCNEGDDLWQMEDADLRDLAAAELARLGLVADARVAGFKVIRERKAYPVYDSEYRDAVDTIATWLKSIENLETVGRNGLHRYNNQDHSMMTAILAAENIAGSAHDVWEVNVERAYHEEFQVPRESRRAQRAA